MVDVGRMLWRLCHALRHDGIDHAEYVDQLTYLLFVKMAEERAIPLPGVSWDNLKGAPDARLIATHRQMLQKLKRADGHVADVFAAATSAFTRPAALRQVIELLDAVEWSALPSDVQADAYEYVLEQAAAEGKKGAGQYFTPRLLMNCIVSCVQPGARAADKVIADPAAGTAGFLVAAHEWAKEHANTRRIRNLAFVGTELVARPRRLALMNLALHRVPNAYIALADALQQHETGFADVVLTNPPFGARGGRQEHREGFWCATNSKQLNFVQHVVGMLRPGGRAAMVLPDNCFFGSGASQLLPGLFGKCDVHTLLRLPVGTFAPYTAGTKANVIFFSKRPPTEEVWIYDARTPLAETERGPALAPRLVADFATCFGEDPDGRVPRAASSNGRWRAFTIAEIDRAGYEIDRLPWRTDVVDSSAKRTSPDLLRGVLHDLEAAADDLRLVIKRMSE